MPTFNTQADANGNWSINLGQSYTQGQQTTVTSKKDGVTETLKLNTPATAIGQGAISFSGPLTSFPKYIGDVTLEASITKKIEGYVFFNYNASYPGIGAFATGLVIKGSVLEIADYAFGKWINATAVKLPESLQIIGSYAFSDWNNLTQLTIPDSVQTIGSYAFSNLLNVTELILGASVKTIASSAFVNMPKLTKLTLNNNLSTIGDTSFLGCIKMTDLTLPDSVVTIGTSAFQNWQSLTSVTFPDTIQTISGSAFADCIKLSEIRIGQNITSIASLAFSNTALQKIYITAKKPPSLSSNTFSGLQTSCVIYVPADSISAYKTASVWSTYANQMVAV